MNKYEVTFYFDGCSPVVTVQAGSEADAIVAARNAEIGAPVPGNIRAVANCIKRGGKRLGAGRKAGKTNADSRNNRLMVRLNDAELAQIKKDAAAVGLSIPAYQRERLLPLGTS